jgi:ArsR family metal-binding transcriptional regulator
MPGAIAVQCFAHLGQDVSAALPYLNTELGSFTFIKDPASVTFIMHGKRLPVNSRRIAVNALKDEAEACKIVEWLKREVNIGWRKHKDITPRFKGMPRPQVILILKCLPKTHCRQCGEPTCMVFATRVADLAKVGGDCPLVNAEAKQCIDDDMAGFSVGSDGIPW